MVMTDPIADLLTRIRNAYRADHQRVAIGYSKFKESIVKLLVDEGYLDGYKVERDEGHPRLIVDIKYGERGEPAIRGLERVSKPGLRIYVRRDTIPYVKNGLGVAVISTSHGVLPDYAARSKGVGGEYICRVW